MRLFQRYREEKRPVIRYGLDAENPLITFFLCESLRSLRLRGEFYCLSFSKQEFEIEADGRPAGKYSIHKKQEQEK